MTSTTSFYKYLSKQTKSSLINYYPKRLGEEPSKLSKSEMIALIMLGPVCICDN